MLGLSGRGQRGVKREVARVQRVYRPAEHGLEVAREALRRAVVRAHHEHRQLQLFIQRRCKVYPMYARKSGNERRKPSALHQAREGGCFLVFKNLLIEYFHSLIIIPFFYIEFKLYGYAYCGISVSKHWQKP